MWSKTYSVTAPEIEPSHIWAIWSDFSLRTQWDDDAEWVKAEGPFKKGTVFYLKPKDMSSVRLEITECIPNQIFTDATKFPLARLYGIHEVEKTEEGVRLTTTIKVTGFLSFFWWKIVGRQVAATIPHQTQCLIDLALKLKQAETAAT